MVVRRKYKSKPPRGYYQGGAVREGGPIPDDAAPEPAARPSMPPPAADDGNPLRRALEAQERAEQLQREHAQQQQASAVDQHIDSLPDLSDHKRQFLKANPDLLRPDMVPLMSSCYHAALKAGIADDTPEMNEAVLHGVIHQIKQRGELRHSGVMQSREQEHERELQENERENSRRLAEIRAGIEPEPEPQRAPAPAAAPPRRSIPMTAPPSREAPPMSGQRHPPNYNTLSADERDIARRSFTDPNMSNHEKELLYLRNRQKYQAMKEDGSYSDQGGR